MEPRTRTGSRLRQGGVDIQEGSGFFNYIHGYVVKARDCVHFSAKEYSEKDAYGAENTDWKRSYRGLPKGTPCLQELCCAMSRDTSRDCGW